MGMIGTGGDAGSVMTSFDHAHLTLLFGRPLCCLALIVDRSVQGIGNSIGKVNIYVVAGGINPQRVLPIMLDVAINNEKLLEDHLLNEGVECISIVDELMEAPHTHWPKPIIQSTRPTIIEVVSQKIVVVGAGR
ncbi:LOW QUALITY PROTEIN: hypothetical protein M8C21_020290, partial [Ambrosia artemisiifolia]